MRTGNLLFSAVQFVFVVVLFLLGGLFIGLEYAPQLRSVVAAFFSGHTGGLLVVGYAILGCACLLLCGFYAMNRGVYYQVAMHAKISDLSIDPQVIRSYVQEYWKEIFPEKNYSADIVLHSNQQIEILAEMPDLPLTEQRVLLFQIEKELGSLLLRTLGYSRKFLVTILVR